MNTRFLMATGADPSRSNVDGENAIQVAEGLRRRGVLRLLNGRVSAWKAAALATPPTYIAPPYR